MTAGPATRDHHSAAEPTGVQGRSGSSALCWVASAGIDLASHQGYRNFASFTMFHRVPTCPLTSWGSAVISWVKDHKRADLLLAWLCLLLSTWAATSWPMQACSSGVLRSACSRSL